MKTMRRLGTFAGAILAAASGWAQTIQFVNISRSAHYVQTTDSSVSSGTLIADPTTPFVFKAAIEGDSATTGSTPITAATFTKPGGSATALTFNSSGHEWVYKDTTQTSMANLNTTYGTGAYGFNITGTPNGTPSVTVGSFASTLLKTPVLTLSGGSWVGSTYQLAAGSTLTVAFNSVYSSAPASNAAFHYDVELNGMGNQNAQDFINWNPQTNTTAVSGPPNFVVNSMVAGSYTLSTTYSDVQNPAANVYGTAFGASLLEYNTSISITVVPEPAVYAELFGVVVLAGAMIHRRRRQLA